MSNVSLSKSVRQNLFAMQGTAEMMAASQNRLATGKKVNSALDNATNYFTASNLNSRAGDLSGLLDGLSNASKTIEAANNGITGIKKLVESAQSIARQALSGGDKVKLEAQYDEIRAQIDALAKDASYNGVNLIKDATTTLKVAFNEKTGADHNELELTSTDLTSTGLSIAAADFTDETTMTAALDSLTTALSTLRDTASSMGANLSTIQSRQDFTKSSINTLQTGADNLVNADINEEAASLLALQTRAQLSQSALSMSNQQDQSVLRLFG